MRLHEYQKQMNPLERIKFLEWKHHHHSVIYKIKSKTILIEPMYKALSLQEKLDLKKNPDQEEIIKQAMHEEQLEFESKIVELHRKTTNK